MPKVKVHIENLKFKAIIGILEHERKTPQEVIVDLTFTYVYKHGNFIDYAQVANSIKALMTDKKFELIEDALVSVKQYLKTSYRIKKLKLKITKPTILDNCVVAVEL
jgi:dihydroneopterin aldolase